MLQLVLGLLVSFIFLLLQMQAQPFRDKGDDVLLSSLAHRSSRSLSRAFYSARLSSPNSLGSRSC